MAQGGNVPDPLEIQFSCKTIFSSGLGGNWYTQTLPNASTKLLGQEIPCVALSHTIFIAISCFLDPILGSGPGPARPGQPEPRPSRAQVGPGSARQGFSRPPLFRGGRELPKAEPRRSGICPRRSRIDGLGSGSGKSKPGRDFPDLR